MEQVQANRQELRKEHLLRPAEEVEGGRPFRALERSGGCRHRPRVEHGHTAEAGVQEGVLADDGIIALEDVQVEGVPDVARLVGVTIEERMALVVAVPARQADAPAIFDRDKMAILLHLGGSNAGRPGKPCRRINGGLEQRCAASGLDGQQRRGGRRFQGSAKDWRGWDRGAGPFPARWQECILGGGALAGDQNQESPNPHAPSRQLDPHAMGPAPAQMTRKPPTNA